MQRQSLKIHPADNVEVALTKLVSGTVIYNGTSNYILTDDIPAKHKFATGYLEEGDNIIMYGVLVGRATKPIAQGGLVSLGNIKHASGNYTLHERKTGWLKPDVSKWMHKTFNGFYRPDGSVGTRNYWLVIPMVFCENRNVDSIQEAFAKTLGYKPSQSRYEAFATNLVKQYQAGKPAEAFLSENIVYHEDEELQKIFPNVDGIKFLNHTLGCGGTKQDAGALCGLLAGYITHPNVAGATVLSLGCQNAQLAVLEEEIHKRDAHFLKPLFLLEQQRTGSETKMLEQGIKQTFAGLIKANECKREAAPVSKLCIGLECGGSDGFSGISANPAIGYTSDLLVGCGGSVILSEFPELCGVEQELSDRCTDENIAERFMQLMSTYNLRAEEAGSGFYANPSPGNIRDGLITDAIKSAGAAKKGGTSPVTDVLDYPEKASKSGLNLLCTPGSDVESTTAEVGAGATMVLFTTGLGTPTGNPVAPVVKIATNTLLYNKMNDIMDINTGQIIEGNETVEQTGERIFDYVIQVANGDIKAKAEAGGHDDFIPWKRGISL